MKIKELSSYRKFLVVCLIVALVSSFITYSIAASSLSRSTIAGGVYPGAPSYTVWSEGGSYYAKNSLGAIVFNGADAAAVIQAALDTSGSAGAFIKGHIDTTTSINLRSYQTIQGEGAASQLHAQGDFPVIIMNGITVATVKDMSIRGGGNTNLNAHGIKILNRITFCHLDTLWIYACRHGIDISGMFLTSFSHVFIEARTAADKSYIGVYTHPPTGGVDTDGNWVDCGALSTVSHGWRLEHCNGMSFTKCFASNVGGYGWYVGAPSSVCTVGHFFAVNCFGDAPAGQVWYFDGTGATGGVIGPIGLDQVYAANTLRALYGKNLVNSMINNVWFYSISADAIQLEGGSRVEINNGIVKSYSLGQSNTYCGVRLINQNYTGIRGLNFVATNGLDAIREEGTSDCNRFLGNDATDGGGITVIGENTISEHNR